MPRAEVRSGDMCITDVEAGQHSLRLKIDWCYSPEVMVQLDEGQTAVFVCRSGPAIGVGDIVLRRHRYMSLVPEGTDLPPQRSMAAELRKRLPLAVGGGSALIFLLVLLGAAGVSPGVTAGVAMAAFLLFLSTVFFRPSEPRP